MNDNRKPNTRGRRPHGKRREAPDLTGNKTVRSKRNARMDMRRNAPPIPRRAPDYFPELPGKDVARIIPLGGVEEVGRNCTVVDINGDIFIMDVGFQFVSEDGAPGIDYVLPNTKYLEKNIDRIKGVIITHGHLDHIGGIPFIMGRIGNPTIYTQNLTSVMIKKRQEEYPDAPKLDIQEVKVGDRIKVGNTFIKFFPVTHSIPDSMGVSLETPHGNIVISGDLKLEHEDGKPSDKEEKIWGKLSEDKNIFFMGDSTNAERDGFSMPETKVHQTIEDIIKTVKGRLIIGTFASQFERMVKILEMAEKLGKKVVLEGRSIKTNVEIANQVGLLNIAKNVIIPSGDIDKYPPDKIIIVATGAQGEEFAALMRIATNKHKFVKLTPRDTIVFSSSVIPGNEVSVQKLKDNLYRHDITLLHYRTSDVHSTGHGNTGELVWINKKVNPTFFMPGYGYHTMLRCHARAVEQSGFPKENIIIPDNGTIIDIHEGKKLQIHKEKVPAAPLLVDGIAIGDMQEVVIRDRQMLAKDGIFVVIATVQLKTGKLRKSPDIISRGFVYIRENQEMFQQARILIKKSVEDTTRNMHPIDLDLVKKELTETLESYLFQKTNKTPIVIPVLIGV
ncbi:MAG: ribonuclease J [Patescibacteria group bacterium UBA2103]